MPPERPCFYAQCKKQETQADLPYIAKMKILITGANGFVGTELCSSLQQRALAHVATVRANPGLGQIAVGDLSTTTDWQAALVGCDCVIHLAARVHVMEEKSGDPLAAFRATNVDATLHLARQAIANGVRRFVFVSSIKVNGEVTVDRPFTAFDTPAPLDPYGQSKLEAELALQELASTTGLELVIVRPPLVYGPGVRANFLNLMKLINKGLPLPLGAIHNRRSMVAVDNLVDLLIVCCQHEQAAGQVFLVSDGQDVSITQLLQQLAQALQKRVWLLPIPASLMTTAARMLGKSAIASRLFGSLQVDIGHTEQRLQWRPPVSMQQALKKTVAHFLSRNKNTK